MKYFIPAIIWAIIILVLSLIAPGNMIHFSWSDLIAWDKLAHLGMYFILAVLMKAGFHCSAYKTKPFWSVVIAGSLFGFLIEGLQYLSHTGRHYELADVAANAFGMLLGVWIFEKLINKVKLCGNLFNKS